MSIICTHLLSLFSLLGLLSAVLYLPALPHLSLLIRTTQLHALSTLFAWLLGALISLLFIKQAFRIVTPTRCLFIASIIFVVSNFLCTFPLTFPLFVLARGLQGLGAGIFFYLSIAQQEQTNTPNSHALIFAFTALMSLLLGGFTYKWFGWKANFYLLAFLGLLLSSLTLSSPQIATPLKKKLKRPTTVILFLLSYTLFITGLVLFLITSPLILINSFNFPPFYVGLATLIIFSGLHTALPLASILIERTGEEKILILGICFIAASSSVLISLAINSEETVFAFILPMLLYGFGAGFAIKPYLLQLPHEKFSICFLTLLFSTIMLLGLMGASVLSLFNVAVAIGGCGIMGLIAYLLKTVIKN